MPSSAPNTSLYVKNINTKVRKPELRQQLYSLFSTYGKVIDVVATRVNGMRGQAFVVFGDLQSATSALRALEGAMFYDKTLSIDYAQKKSHATLVQEKGPAALFDPNLLASTRASGSGTATADGAPLPGKVTYSSAQAEARGRDKKRARDEARERGEAVADEEDEEEEGGDEKRVKTSHGDADEEGDAMEMEDDSDNDDAAPGPPAPEIDGDGEPAPSATLYCSDLPTEVTDDMLGVLFQQYSGFQTVTHRPARAGKAPFALVRYDSVPAATAAREALKGFLLKPGARLEVQYASEEQARS